MPSRGQPFACLHCPGTHCRHQAALEAFLSTRPPPAPATGHCPTRAQRPLAPPRSGATPLPPSPPSLRTFMPASRFMMDSIRSPKMDDRNMSTPYPAAATASPGQLVSARSASAAATALAMPPTAPSTVEVLAHKVGARVGGDDDRDRRERRHQAHAQRRQQLRQRLGAGAEKAGDGGGRMDGSQVQEAEATRQPRPRCEPAEQLVAAG